jgi:diguanylate cyclase (GGDEF)-like protein/PAS domain S-box-containing protein
MARGFLHGPREAARVAALRRYEVLDRPVDPDLRALAELAAQLCATARAGITLVDHDAEHHAVVLGPGDAVPAAGDVVPLVVAGGVTVALGDAALEPHRAVLPTATGLATVATYAATPLVTPDGHAVGAIWVACPQERAIGAGERRALEVLAGQVIALFELRAQARALTRATARFEVAFRNAPIGMALVGADGAWTQVNDALGRVVGDLPERLVGTDLDDLVYEEDLVVVREALADLRRGTAVTRRLEVRLLHRSGRLVWAAVSASVGAAEHGDVVDLVLQVEDITDRRAQEEELQRRATHDPLTGLPNRLLLADRLETALERLRREVGEVTVMLLDLDGFKEVNDTRGHVAGDRLLIAVAERLRRGLRATDTVVRLGGDEFVVICEERVPTGEGRRIAERIIAALACPVVVDGVEIRVGSSVGVVATTRPVTAEELLARADLALYAAKAGGRNRVELGDTPEAPRAV